MSGQRVSFAKSSLFMSKNTNVEIQQAISSSLRIPRVEDLGRYLGASSFHRRINQESYADLILRVQNRLARWKRKTLSMAGRMTLSQSVLSAIPSYTMQSAYLPTRVTSQLERLSRDFL